MNKYFLVPVTSKNVKLNGNPLKKVLKEIDEELFDREERRLDLTYELNEDIEKIQKFNEETHRLYQKKDIPEKLIIFSNDFETKELVTSTLVECNHSYLDVFAVEMKAAAEVLLDTDYYEQIDKFIKISKNMTNNSEKKI